MGLPVAGDPSGFTEALMTDKTQGALFDYEALDAENRIVVQQRTTEIHDLVRKTAENVVQIGAKLAEVQQRLSGRFTDWLEREFSWSERTAYNYIAVWQKFGNQKSIAKIANSALYLLSAPGTPEIARRAAIEMADAGEPVTHKMAQVLVAAAKEAEPKTAEFDFTEEEADENDRRIAARLDEIEAQPALVELPESEVALCFCGHRADEHKANGDCKKCTCELYEEMPPEQYAKAEADRKALEAAPTPEESGVPKVQSVEEAPKPSATPKRDRLVAEKATTDAEKLWGAAAIQINIRLMPVDDDPRGRQAIIAMSADDGQPMIQSKRLQIVPGYWPTPVEEMLSAFAKKLIEQSAAKQAVKPATKKPAAKAAKKTK